MNTVSRTLDTLFANRRSASTRNSARRRLAKWLCIEQLEDRRLLALVSWWTADNTGNDSAGMNHGTLMNGATYAVGQINQAFSFDGIDDRILVADSPSFELGGSLTIEGWIKVNSIPPNAHGEILFRGDSRPGLDPYSLAIEPNGQLNFLICSETSAVSIQSPAGLGQFVHVAATLDDLTGEMALYQNGVLVAQTTTSVRPFKYLDPTQNPAIGIGNANATYNARFDGLIDELRLYDVALTAEEVLSHFNAEKGSLQPTVSINDTSVTEGETSETFLGAFVTANSGGLSSAKNIVFGHDGNGDGIQDLYVADGNASEVIRYDGATGEFMDVFVSSGSGGLENPWAMAFGPDGNLYVGGRYIGVLRYSGTTGDFLDLYVSSEDYGIPKNINGILFGPDGNLYVSNSAGGGGAAGLHEVLRFQGPLKASPGAAMPAVGQTGAVFVANGSGGLSNPNGLAFGPDGNLYVANTWLDSVNRYDGASGAFLNTFVTPGSGGLDITSVLSFGNDGYFYVTSQGTNAVLRYDGVSGAFVDAVIPSGSGGLAGAPGLAFDGNGNIYVASGSQVLRYGKTSDADFSIRLSAPFPMWVTVDYSTANGSATAGSDYISTAGTVTFAPGQTVKTIFVPIKDDFVSESTEIFYVNLANPVGGAIADGQGVGVIIDDEAPSTLFYDSFEVGEWNGLWVEDSQNDWFRSTQRAKDGSWSAEVDGSASNATLTTANAIDLSGVGQSTLTFDWLIESGFDSGEYLSLDISTNGGASWTQDVRRLSGNVSQEGVWHSETVDLTPYASSNMKVRFRAKVSASDEDANVDNVRIVAMPLGPNMDPVANAGGPYAVNEGSPVLLSGSGSIDYDGSIASYAWDLDGDGQYDDASGVSVNFTTTVSGLTTVGLQVTDNRGATSTTTASVTVNNVAPTANAGSDLQGSVGTPVNLSAAGSSDPGNDILSYAWDLDNDGQYDDASGVNAQFTAAVAGAYTVGVKVTDADGAVSTDSAIITITSGPTTKFYVVNDGSPDRTYEYGATGTSIENYALDSGNSMPRGVATTAAGDKVWVVDANRKVYVYDNAGTLLGSWTAGSFDSRSDIQGIATDGTDIWIVDAKSDKVFRYFGAASRLSGSQTASSFWLPWSNWSSRDIVTDGTYLWILNDLSSSDKVFKYRVADESLVGSWTIDSANKTPTGLTIDPTGTSQSIWIVDSGTDMVYEYANARSKTSGSLSASATFALAAGNTNPQGIADPPPAGSASTPARVVASAADDSTPPLAASWKTPIRERAPMVSQDVDEFIGRFGVSTVKSRTVATTSDAPAYSFISTRPIAVETHRCDFEESLDVLARDLLAMQSSEVGN